MRISLRMSRNLAPTAASMSAANSAVAPPAEEAVTYGLGDPQTWVHRYGEFLLRYAAARVGDVATAEDLVQETLLAALKTHTLFDGRCDPKTWLVAILKRKVADFWRRSGRRRFEPHEPGAIEEPSPRCELEAAEFWAVVSRCASGLPAHLARAFRLRTFGEQEPATICDTEGISRKNLSVRLHRARRLLRECLEARWFLSHGDN